MQPPAVLALEFEPELKLGPGLALKPESEQGLVSWPEPELKPEQGLELVSWLEPESEAELRPQPELEAPVQAQHPNVPEAEPR